MLTNDDLSQLALRSKAIMNSSQWYDELRHTDNIIKECFDDLQSQLQDIEVLQQPFNDLYLATTSSSRDSGLPPVSSSSSSRCSSILERENTSNNLLDRSFQQDDDFEYLLEPSINHSHRISVYLNGVAIPMPSIHNKTRQRQSRGRSVHWEDEFIPPSQNENHDNQSHSTDVKKSGQHVCVNASLPYHSKLNIRVQVNRINRNDDNHVKATATVQRIDPRQDHKHFEDLQRAYCQHYLLPAPNEQLIPSTKTDVPLRYERSPRNRQISIPISLPVDHRLFLYIRNGEIYARC
ncbi:unnamed protein product [Rotaria magnacalcarata]|uniref:Uncharacterized protein n=1 Tax=Rotaria magnacalcarata TaxID=392030 RepID=A0A8S2J753_9BILA|nr:unnamed protein product [Rotaria magnacalcarata]CAF3958709.1 unnamed protein product [Rotaria magnacalcarata]CAF3972689.1 unnamed protein product [Rotaria magnacalcarata]